MKTTFITKYTKKFCTVAGLLLAAASTFAGSFTLPATTSGPGKIDLGFYAGGSSVVITATGQISLLAGSGFDTFADGSLVNPINPVGELANYDYVNAGATGYPTTFGGDGINHYPGGGANFDINAGTFTLGSAISTDTTNPNTIRFGAVVGTFNPNPAQSDWFLIGTGKTVVVPAGGANLYIAVSDTSSDNNAGDYTCNVEPDHQDCETQLANANQKIQDLTLPLQVLTADFRLTFKDPNFQIRGTTDVEKMQNLVNAILDLPKGQQQKLYRSLGGKKSGRDD